MPYWAIPKRGKFTTSMVKKASMLLPMEEVAVAEATISKALAMVVSMITLHSGMQMISSDNSLVAEILLQISWTMMTISSTKDLAVPCSNRWTWIWEAARCSNNHQNRDVRMTPLEWAGSDLAATLVLTLTMTMISATLAVWEVSNRSSRVHSVEWAVVNLALLRLRPTLKMVNKWQELKRLQLTNMVTKQLKSPRNLMMVAVIVPARPIWSKEMADNNRGSKLFRVVQRHHPKTKSQNPAISTSDSRLSIEFS